MEQSLDSITLQGFRQFESLTLDGLGLVNLLFGANNSGKTTLLEALALLSDPLNPLVWLQASQRQLSARSSFIVRPRLEMIRWLFCQADAANYQNSAIPQMRVVATGSTPILEVEATLADVEAVSIASVRETSASYGDLTQGEPSMESEGPHEGIELSISVREKIAQLTLPINGPTKDVVFERMEFWEGTVRIRPNPQRPRLNCVAIQAPLQSAGSLALDLAQATREGLKASVLQLIKHVDSDIEDIQVLPTRNAPQGIYIQHQRLGLVPIYAFGDGLRRILAIAFSIPRARNGLLLIDEIETAIHASLLNETFAWLVDSCKTMNVQLFATTHSLEALDAILNATPTEQDVVGYGLRDNGKRVQRYSEDLLSRIRNERGLDPR